MNERTCTAATSWYSGLYTEHGQSTSPHRCSKRDDGHATHECRCGITWERRDNRGHGRE